MALLMATMCSKLANDVRAIGVVHRTHLDLGIIVDKVEQAAAAHNEAGDDLASIQRL